jgi:hypothetical protein
MLIRLLKDLKYHNHELKQGQVIIAIKKDADVLLRSGIAEAVTIKYKVV